MGVPTDRELLRVQTQERVDAPDFQHLSRQVLFWHESIAAVLANEGLIRGFQLSVVDPTTLRVTPNTSTHKGAFIVPELGAVNNQAPHNPDTSYSVIVDLNPVAKDRSLSTYPTNQFLHVYASVTWAPAKLDQRVFWTPPSGPEVENSINTRFSLEWQLRVQPHYLDPPPRSVRIGTVWWSGVLTATDLYQSAQMLFEGCAVEDGSAVEVPSGGSPSFGGYWQLSDEGTIPDFDRSDNRWEAGAKTFAEFSRMVLREIQEVKSQSRVTVPKHWERPPYGLSVRAAQSPTFTIGEGTRLSEGNQNGVSDALNPGYRNIGPALTYLINAAVTDGLDDVCIHLKPGRYSITSPVSIPGTIRLHLAGCGPLETQLKITNTGKISIETDASSEASAGLIVSNLSIWGTTSDNLIEVQSSYIGDETLYCFYKLCVKHTAGASWLRQTQSGRNVRLHLEDVHLDEESNIRFLAARQLRVYHSELSHIYIADTDGTIDASVLVSGSHCSSIRVDDAIGDVVINGSTFHHLNFTACDLVSLNGVKFSEVTSLEDALGSVETVMLVSDTTRVQITSSLFRTVDDADDALLWVDNCGRVVIGQTGFVLSVGASSVPSYGVRATNMTPGPGDGPKAVMRECWMVNPGDVWVDGFVVDGCRFVSDSGSLGLNTMVANAPRILSSDVEVASSTPSTLFDQVGPIRRCRIEVDGIGPGLGEVVAEEDLEILYSEIDVRGGGLTLVSSGHIRIRDLVVSGYAPGSIVIRTESTDKRVYLESVKSPLDVSIDGSSSLKTTLTVKDCEFPRFLAAAGIVNASLVDSVFTKGASIIMQGSSWKGSFVATSCTFYPKREWNDGVASSLHEWTLALDGYHGLRISDDQLNGPGIERIVVEECEFNQIVALGGQQNALRVETRNCRELVVRDNNFHLQWPDLTWNSYDGAVWLTYASRIQVHGNQFWCDGGGSSDIGPILSVREAGGGNTTTVTRSSVSFDDNAVHFASPTSTMAFDVTYGSVVHLKDIAAFIDITMSFCRNKLNARWQNPNPRVVWNDNAGTVSATNKQGIAYENLIVDYANVLNSFSAAGASASLIYMFAGGFADNFFLP